MNTTANTAADRIAAQLCAELVHLGRVRAGTLLAAADHPSSEEEWTTGAEQAIRAAAAELSGRPVPSASWQLAHLTPGPSPEHHPCPPGTGIGALARALLRQGEGARAAGVAVQAAELMAREGWVPETAEFLVLAAWLALEQRPEDGELPASTVYLGCSRGSTLAAVRALGEDELCPGGPGERLVRRAVDGELNLERWRGGARPEEDWRREHAQLLRSCLAGWPGADDLVWRAVQGGQEWKTR